MMAPSLHSWPDSESRGCVRLAPNGLFDWILEHVQDDGGRDAGISEERVDC